MSASSPSIAVIKQQLQPLAGLKLIYLFGSRAEGQETASSDWDIAFLADKPLPLLERWQLAQQLASELGVDVDLIDLAAASTVLRMQVIANGRLLFGEKYDSEVFETQVYSMYGRLQESRQDIVQDFIKDLKGGEEQGEGKQGE